MPRDYQLKRKNPYHIESEDMYREVLYIIKGYRYLKERQQEIILSASSAYDGMPRGTQAADTTFWKAATLEPITKKVNAIEWTIRHLAEKYKDTYTGEPFLPYKAFMSYEAFCYYRSRDGKDEAPAKRTWLRYRSEFVWNVAKKLNYI